METNQADKYFKPLIQEILKHRDPVRAKGAAAYMKHQFDYLGLSSPVRREVAKSFFQENGWPSLTNLPGYIAFLWDLPHREFHYIGLDLGVKFSKKLTVAHLPMIQYMLNHHQWWDSIDAIAANIVGPFILNHPQLEMELTQAWSESDNMWLNRTAMIYQLKYGQKTNTELLSRYLLRWKDSKEFFHQKAIGWALRQYSRQNPNWVVAFVSNNALKPLSKREALRLLPKS